MQSTTETWHLLVLHRQTIRTPRHCLWLLQRFGSAKAVHELVSPRLAFETGLPPPLLEVVGKAPTREICRAVDRDLRWLSGNTHHLVVWGTNRYPRLLSETDDPPPLLFADGDIGLLNTRQLAIVGSRNTTSSGRKIALMFAESLSVAGLTITSGLALGIDAAAHEGALRGSGKTVAVLGSGCDIIHPRSNRRLAERVRETGLVVSEFPLATPARAENFPRRNRIVTGMSIGTLVIEAALRSGSLISARLAAEQGREVFAIPGSIFSEQSRGCHQLIREGARLTEGIQDIAEELGGLVVAQIGNERVTPDLPEPMGSLLKLVCDTPTAIDDLIGRSGEETSAVISAMVELEIAGLVESVPGGYILAPSWS